MLKHLIRGAATYVPGVHLLTQRRMGGGDKALYCYGVWMRHLVTAHANGLCAAPPRHVAEFGAGDSIGVGLAALLSGAETYTGLDVIAYADTARDLAMFDELVLMFRNKAAIPGPEILPQVKPYIEDYHFPSHILSDDHLARCLADDRVAGLRKAIVERDRPDSPVRYFAPWGRADIEPASVDMIFSQAVMQYVPDLPDTYALMKSWLTSEGFVSLQIDLKCHGCADEWNGHYRYSDRVWPFIKGSRRFYLNRMPLSSHLAAMDGAGLELRALQTGTRPSRLSKDDLAPRFRHLSEEDLTTSGALIQGARTHTLAGRQAARAIWRDQLQSTPATRLS